MPDSDQVAPDAPYTAASIAPLAAEPVRCPNRRSLAAATLATLLRSKRRYASRVQSRLLLRLMTSVGSLPKLLCACTPSRTYASAADATLTGVVGSGSGSGPAPDASTTSCGLLDAASSLAIRTVELLLTPALSTTVATVAPAACFCWRYEVRSTS